MCHRIAGFNSVESAYYGVSRANNNGAIQMDCFIQSQNSYTPLPYTLASMQTSMKAHPALFPAKAYNNTPHNAGSKATFYRSYEIGIVDWLAQGSDGKYPSAETQTYFGLLDGVADVDTTLGKHGKLEYAGIDLVFSDGRLTHGRQVRRHAAVRGGARAAGT